MIFPLSNPTSRSEATPTDLLRWTDGRALIGTGSPFPPFATAGRSTRPTTPTSSRASASGVLAAEARRVTDTMFMAAAKALAELSPAAQGEGTALLPPVDQLRSVAVAIASVVARQAQQDGVAPRRDTAALHRRIRDEVWEPVYRRYRLVP